MKHRFIAVALLAAWAAFVTVSARAAEKTEAPKPEAGKNGWIALFDGKNDLKGWHPRPGKPADKFAWVAKDGMLINEKNDATDIISDVPQMDHELHVEFCCPPGGNSGVYLQGRYEVQVDDSSGAYRAKRLSNTMCGAIYSKIAPKASVNPGEVTDKTYADATNWQTFDIKFWSAQLGPDGKVAKKARITVVHNGVPIIEDAEINGVTGSAVDNKEGTPAGLMLQGDHSRMKYRNILYRPMKAEAK